VSKRGTRAARNGRSAHLISAPLTSSFRSRSDTLAPADALRAAGVSATSETGDSAPEARGPRGDACAPVGVAKGALRVLREGCLMWKVPTGLSSSDETEVRGPARGESSSLRKRGERRGEERRSSVREGRTRRRHERGAIARWQCLERVEQRERGPPTQQLARPPRLRVHTSHHAQRVVLAVELLVEVGHLRVSGAWRQRGGAEARRRGGDGDGDATLVDSYCS
jgi:hypothetical protein